MVPVRQQIWPSAAIFDIHRYHIISKTAGGILSKPCIWIPLNILMCLPENDSGLSINIAIANCPLFNTVRISLSHLPLDHWSDFLKTCLRCSTCGLVVSARKWFQSDDKYGRWSPSLAGHHLWLTFLLLFCQICYSCIVKNFVYTQLTRYAWGERGGSVVECRTPEREVRGSKPTAAVLCPWARHFTPRKYWLITQEAVAPSRHDWKIVDWDVKPQYKHKICLILFNVSHLNILATFKVQHTYNKFNTAN